MTTWSILTNKGQKLLGFIEESEVKFKRPEFAQNTWISYEIVCVGSDLEPPTTRVSASEFFGHNIRDNPRQCLIFSEHIYMLYIRNISKN